MELQTINKVAKEHAISTRMLRYYEQIGLIQSKRIDDYAYRVYDVNAVNRLKQIIVLRKLRIPVKQIAGILDNPSAVEIVEIFRRNISELDEEIAALSTVKSILQHFVEDLRVKANIDIDLLDNDALCSAVYALSFPDNHLKVIKENGTMEELNKASKRIGKLTDRDVRIVFIPPSEVASYRCEGLEPEDEANEMIQKFVKENNLAIIKPDVRCFGFNAPNPKDETGYHGYEFWVTIPDGFDVPGPYNKKHFPGGMYCAHMIPIGAFDEWALLSDWIEKDNAKYVYRGTGNPDNMFDSLEECLNYPGHIEGSWDNVQLDLLIPIKEK